MRIDYFSKWLKAIAGGIVQVVSLVLGAISTAATFIPPIANRAPGYVRPIGALLLIFGFLYASFRAYVDILVTTEELRARLTGARITLKSCFAEESIKKRRIFMGTDIASLPSVSV
jgi:hypothetical protein